MAEEFDLALYEMGMLEPARETEEDRANDRALEALLEHRPADAAQEERGQGEEHEARAATDAELPAADPALDVAAQGSAALAAGEVQDMISLLAAGVDIGDAPASALRNRLRRSFATRIQRKLAGLAEPVPAIQKRSYRKRASV